MPVATSALPGTRKSITTIRKRGISGRGFSDLGQVQDRPGRGSGPGPESAAAQRAAAADGLGPDPDPGPGPEIFQL